MAYLDTSVLAAYYCPERISAKVQRRIERLAQATISPLVELELHSAVAGKVRAGEFDLPAARRVLAMFQVHVSDGLFAIVPIGAREFDLSRRWIAEFRTPLRTLDVLHLAAAFANDLPLLTADRDLAKAAKLLSVKHDLIA